MIANRCLLVLSVTGAVACGSGSPKPPADQPRHPLLEALGPPPLNRPVTAVPLPAGEPVLPAGGGPVVLLVSEGRPYRGVLTGDGRVTTRPGRVEFASSGRAPIQILYRLPQGLPAVAEWDANGSATLVERSSTAGPDRLVLVRSDRGLLLAHVWVKSAGPAIAELGDGLRLVRAIRPLIAAREVAPEPGVEVLDGGQSVGVVPRATPTRVETRAGAFDVLVETNRPVYSKESDGRGAEYVTKVWLVRSGP
jgi:hypothetical protein